MELSATSCPVSSESEPSGRLETPTDDFLLLREGSPTIGSDSFLGPGAGGGRLEALADFVYTEANAMSADIKAGRGVE